MNTPVSGILQSLPVQVRILGIVALAMILGGAVGLEREAKDAAFLVLAEKTAQLLITGDWRLYKAVHEHLDWVQWLGDYKEI
jgi:predicted nucleic acid-binding protein